VIYWGRENCVKEEKTIEYFFYTVTRFGILGREVERRKGKRRKPESVRRKGKRAAKVSESRRVEEPSGLRGY
jgi:hypothetical protein